MERRRFPRYGCDFLAEIYETDAVTLLGIGNILNIGKNCAGLETIVPFLVGQRFFVRFLDQQRRQIAVEAIVRRLELHGLKRYYGIEFINISEKDSSYLDQIIGELGKK